MPRNLWELPVSIVLIVVKVSVNQILILEAHHRIVTKAKLTFAVTQNLEVLSTLKILRERDFLHPLAVVVPKDKMLFFSKLPQKQLRLCRRARHQVTTYIFCVAI